MPENDKRGELLRLYFETPLRKIILGFLMLLAGAVLIYFHWNEFLFMSHETLKYIEEIKLSYALLAFLLYILSVLLFARRWKKVLDSLGYKFKTSTLIPIIFSAIPINNLTPASRMGGEPLKIIWIKQLGVRYSDAFTSIVFERLVETIPVVALAAYALYSLFPLFHGTFQPLKITLSLILTSTLLLVSFFVFRIKFRFIIKELIKYAKQLRRAFMPVLYFSSTVWVLEIIRLKLITFSLGLHVPMNIIAIISLLYLVLGSIPFTPGGLGIVESGLVSALTLFGISPGAAAGVVLVERFISFALASIIGSFFLVYFGGIKIWKNKHKQASTPE